MKKKFKRLLGLVMALLMIVGIIPLSGMSEVNAMSAGEMVFFNTANTSWFADDGCAPYALFRNSSQNNIGSWNRMQLDEGTVYGVQIPEGAVEVQFCRSSDGSTNTLYGGTPWRSLSQGTNNCFYAGNNGSGEWYSDSWTNDGGWTTHTYNPPAPVPTNFYYANADLVDYYNDARVDTGDTATFSTNNQGDLLGDFSERNANNTEKGAAFTYFNGKISQEYGNNNNDIPLYFGSLLFVNNRVGRTDLQSGNYTSLKRWNSTANVALTVNGQTTNDTGFAQHNTDASVQGLVNSTLGSNNTLLGLNGTELPYFSETMANSWTVGGKKLMKYYQGYKFPFNVESVDGSNVKKYSYDSATDYSVTLPTDNSKQLVASATGTSNIDGTRGYFPFNTAGETDRSKINYGFGTKFTIPFTINKNGTIDGTENGTPITFEFTGDDDVWVFLDGKLILDMGGAHGKSVGKIDFKNLTATVSDACVATTGSQQLLASGNSNNATAYQGAGLMNYLWAVGCSVNGAAGANQYAQERSSVATGVQTKNFSDHGEEYANSFKDSSKTHTLVMFYMERGMFDSNMKVEFTINPLPSGLTLSKTLDTANVNSGLVDAVKEADKDDFEFKIQTKDLTAGATSYSDVENLGYTLNNYNNEDTPDHTATNSTVTGVGAKSFAHSFINTATNADAFKGGTAFKITENSDADTALEYDYTKTKWTVYDTKNNNNVVASSSNEGQTTAEFNMGDENSNEFVTFDYNVNFTNTPKVGTLTLKKEYTGTAPTGDAFEFTVLVDLTGGTEYKPYPLAYTSDKDEGGTTDAEGKLSIQAGETVTFAGIPAGATYKITETEPTADAEWIIDSVAGATQDSENKYVATGRIESEGATSTVTYTNKDARISLNPDQIVIDYGKAVRVDVLANDSEMLTNNSGYTAKVVGFKTYEADSTDTADYKDTLSAEDTNGYGNYSIKEDKVEFQLTKFLDGVEKVNCVVELTSTKDQSAKKYYLNELDIIPATSMYYEDNFSNAISYTGAETSGGNYNSVWTIASSGGYDNLQNDGTIGANAPYGYDASYNDDTKYSNGSANSIYSVSETGGYNKTYATFTFTGTGFDLISKTSSDAGIIKAEIYQGDKAEGTIYKYAQVANVGASELYQIPVLSCEGMPYGEYTVKVQVFEEYQNDSFPQLNRGGKFEFDALRIYDPIDVSAEDLTGDAAIAQNAYIQDGEAYEQHIRLRDYILSKEKFDATLEEEDGDGVVYIDATVSNPTQANDDGVVADYKMAGPNNETYLKSGNGIVFILNAKEVPKSIQIGAKSVVGERVNLCVDIMNPANNDVSVYIDEAFSQAAAQNYSTFTDSDDNTVTDFTPYFVKNGDYYQAYISIYNWDDGILSITDIKATFNSATDMPVTVDQGAVSAAASKIRARMGYIPSEDVTEEEDTEENKSELYSAEFTTAKVVATKQATLNVISTADIEEMVIINAQGKKLSVASSSEMTADGNKMWTLKFKTGQLGTCIFNVHGVTANGTETEPVEVSIEATKR